MKKLVKTLGLVGVLVLGIILGANLNKPTVEYVEKSENVDVSFVWEQKGQEQKLDGYYLEDGDIVVEFTDGSFAISNEKTNFHMFQVVDLGDWDYQVDNSQQLENLIKTYLSMKNTGMY